MQPRKLFACLTIGCLPLLGCSSNDDATNETPPPAEPAKFVFTEGTIKSLHAALEAGTITCEAVIQGYIDRIETYDFAAEGPQLRSVIAINPTALDTARAKDAQFAEKGIDGPMYCVPVLPKDNFNTFDMPTTGGGLVFQYNQPTADAYSIARMRAAGAIIIGKANMDEFAFGFNGNSSVRGLVKNAYDLSKGAGGSSSGTGTAIAASLALLGTGSDTGGSIRVPSSLGGLVGIRPSLRLVSQDGIMPLASFQDTGGPMCRAVEDCAVALDAMVGFDPSSHSGQRSRFAIDAPLIATAGEYQTITHAPVTYTGFLEDSGLVGARIGVLRTLFGNGTGDNAIVQAVIDKALDRMRAAGAIVEEVVIPDSSVILSRFASLSGLQFATDLQNYLQSWSDLADGHVTTYQAFADSGLYLSGNRSTILSRNNIGQDLSTNETWIRNTVERPAYVRPRILQALDNIDASGRVAGAPYDALLYPAIQGLAGSLGGSPSAGSNNRLSPFSGFPALTLPAGMTDEVTDTVQPVQPVGMELLGREFDEGTLIRIAYAYQQLAQPRHAPTHTPELSGQ